MKIFKITGLAIAIMLLAGSESNAQDSNSVTIKMALSGRPGQATIIPLEFGVKKGATNGLDLALGEKEIPPFFPPDGLDGRLVFEETPGDRTHTYKDFKNLENGTRYTVKYFLKLQPGPLRRDPDPNFDYLNVYFKWDELSPYIDSARITDDFGVIDINMKDTTEFVFNNEFIDDLYITVHFNFAETSVNELPEITTENNLLIYPNPAQDEMFIKLDGEQFHYRVISVTGHTLISGKSENNSTIDISALPRGVYALAITGEKTSKVQQFIKQ